MYKVLFFNGNSCTGFYMDFNSKENALHALNWFVQAHGSNSAEVFDDKPKVKKLSKYEDD